jgi:hypothetical protein
MPRDPQGNAYVAIKELILGNERFLRTDDGSAVMNVNGAPAGSSVVLWNGTGAGDSGGDWTASGDGSETAGAMRTGTNGWDTGVRGNGEASVFSTTAFDIQASHDSISFWVNTQAKDSNTTLRLRWYHSGATEGTVVIVDNYTSHFDIGVWQLITIPLADFGLPASQLVDELRVQFQANGPKTQRYFLDDIELNPTGAGGGPYTFRLIAPDASTRYHVSMLVLMVSGASSGWNSGSFGNIPALANGVLLRQRTLSTGDTQWSLNSKDNVDLFGRFHPQDDIEFADGNLLVGFMVKPGKASIIVTNDNALEFVIRDDLSGIDNMRAFAHFGTEVS